MINDGKEKHTVGRRCRAAAEAFPSIKRRVEDAVENVGKLESIGLSRSIAVVVSSRAFGVSVEKLTEMLNGKKR